MLRDLKVGDRIQVTRYSGMTRGSYVGVAEVTSLYDGDGCYVKYEPGKGDEGGCGYIDPDDEWELLAGDREREISDECDALKALLLHKNKKYGDSILNPVRIFARNVDSVTGVLVRIDDKLTRLLRGEDDGEDTILDLIGYLIMLRIARRKAKDT